MDPQASGGRPITRREGHSSTNPKKIDKHRRHREHHSQGNIGCTLSTPRLVSLAQSERGGGRLACFSTMALFLVGDPPSAPRTSAAGRGRALRPDVSGFRCRCELLFYAAEARTSVPAESSGGKGSIVLPSQARALSGTVLLRPLAGAASRALRGL